MIRAVAGVGHGVFLLIKKPLRTDTRVREKESFSINTSGFVMNFSDAVGKFLTAFSPPGNAVNSLISDKQNRIRKIRYAFLSLESEDP